MKKKKQNVRGGVECRVWLEKTFAKYDRNSPDLIISDQAIGKMFCLNACSVARIRHELGIPSPRVRYRIASGRLGAEEEAAPIQEPIQELTRPRFPAWVKEGAWVVASSDITGESFLGEIVEVCKEAFHVKLCEKDLVFSYSPEEATCDVFPICFAPYNYKQAKQLLGKVVEYKKGPHAQIQSAMLITNVSKSECFEEVYINDLRFATLKEMGATIDGVPIGVPKTDFEACRAKTPEE